VSLALASAGTGSELACACEAATLARALGFDQLVHCVRVPDQKRFLLVLNLLAVPIHMLPQGGVVQSFD